MYNALSHKIDGSLLQQLWETNTASHIKPFLSLGVSPAGPHNCGRISLPAAGGGWLLCPHQRPNLQLGIITVTELSGERRGGIQPAQSATRKGS